MKINRNYKNLKENYLFAEVASRTNAFKAANPQADIIRLGIGDVTKPLVGSVVKAAKKAADEMASEATFKGYGPYEGYDFLRGAISDYYADRVKIDPADIFISDGAKSDLANILDLFDADNTVLIPDPVYPVYLDTNIMDGRKIIYTAATAENNYCPLPDKNIKANIIYLCSPNNPTGAAYDRNGLKAWVDYALTQNAVILFDAAYEAFVTEDLPRSIYEIKGAEKCAIEFCSMSKTAGFTGMRCGYTIVPHELEYDGVSLRAMWFRRQATKFNGTSYVIQKAAEAIYSPEGLKEIRENIKYYQANAKIIMDALDAAGIKYGGGINSPYIWLKCPNGMKSWEFFDYLLKEANIVGTPGSGFGVNGEGYFRLTAFGNKERIKEAAERIKKLNK